jgi:hypothetical protein
MFAIPGRTADKPAIPITPVLIKTRLFILLIFNRFKSGIQDNDYSPQSSMPRQLFFRFAKPGRSASKRPFPVLSPGNMRKKKMTEREEAPTP